MENVFFTLIGLDIDKNIKAAATCEIELQELNEALSSYDLIAISTEDNSFFVTVNNPNDFYDIAVDLGIKK